LSLGNLGYAACDRFRGVLARRFAYCNFHGKAPLLQVNGLIMPGLVELCAPYLVYPLMLGAAESHGCPEPNVEIPKIFEGSD
jgi:hypothetical protein